MQDRTVFDWEQLNNTWPILPAVVVYCNGVCLNGGTLWASAGFGVWFEDPNFQVFNGGGPVRDPQTGQRAELTAIYEAMLRAPHGNHLRIYTNSDWAMNCATIWVDDWEFNLFRTRSDRPMVNSDIVKKIMEARRGYRGKVDLRHVPAQCGLHGNIEADNIAKAAALEASQSPL